MAEAVNHDDDLLTVQEYAERYRVHVQTVYAAIRMKRLQFPVERAGKRSLRIRVPRATAFRIEPRTFTE